MSQRRPRCVAALSATEVAARAISWSTDRCLTAFEDGTSPEEICCQPVRELADQLDALETRCERRDRGLDAAEPLRRHVGAVAAAEEGLRAGPTDSTSSLTIVAGTRRHVTSVRSASRTTSAISSRSRNENVTTVQLSSSGTVSVESSPTAPPSPMPPPHGSSSRTRRPCRGYDVEVAPEPRCTMTRDSKRNDSSAGWSRTARGSA